MEAELTRFVLEPDEARSLVERSGGAASSALDVLPALAKLAKALARPPISNYRVGAAGLSSDGRIFLGVNLEFPDLPLHHSVHAEQFLIANATSHVALDMQFLAVSSVPCGHCRQFLQEIRGAAEIKVLVAEEEKAEEKAEYIPLSHLLPRPFGPDDLLCKDSPLQLEPHDNGLERSARRNGASGPDEELRTAAWEAANQSHAPYSGCPSGAALMDTRGRVFAGSYSESAAYNPSLGPVQAALVAYVARGGGDYTDIVAAVLVEKEGAVVGQESTARMLMQAISPRCDFRVFRCPVSPKSPSPPQLD